MFLTGVVFFAIGWVAAAHVLHPILTESKHSVLIFLIVLFGWAIVAARLSPAVFAGGSFGLIVGVLGGPHPFAG